METAINTELNNYRSAGNNNWHLPFGRELAKESSAQTFVPTLRPFPITFLNRAVVRSNAARVPGGSYMFCYFSRDMHKYILCVHKTKIKTFRDSHHTHFSFHRVYYSMVIVATVVYHRYLESFKTSMLVLSIRI